MIAVYCRVSSAKQSTVSQRDQLDRWISAHQIQPESVRWFEDKESGRSLSRPEFERMQKAIFSGEIDTVVVWKLDRISRRLTDGINVIADWCERGIRVVSVTQQIDLSGPVGRMLASVMFGLAEIENEHRAERQAAGIAVAKSNGVYRGRKAGSLAADPSRAKELADKGLTPSEIGKSLGVTARTIRRYLASS